MSGYWFVPTVVVVAAVVTALVLLEIDDRLADDDRSVGFTGGPESARELLSAISSSTLTLTALVFSVTVVVLQLASAQFSPRVLRTFLRDRRNQATLGIFLATFVYALVVLRDVRGVDDAPDAFVPGLATAGAFILAVVAIAFFVQYIHNIANSLRVIEIIGRIARETTAAIERVHPADGATSSAPASGDAAEVITAAKGGVVVAVDLDRLASTARRAACELVVQPRVGDFVASASPLVTARRSGRSTDLDHDEVLGAFTFDREREVERDPAFGFRQLVDISERALSPGVNDPTTAVQCLDHLHDLLRRLLPRPLPGWRSDGDGLVALRQHTWDDYVALALDEVRHWGADSLQIHDRITALLDDLTADAPPERVLPLADQRRRLLARRGDLPPTEHDVLDRG